jgi:hypothetical protein
MKYAYIQWFSFPIYIIHAYSTRATGETVTVTVSNSIITRVYAGVGSGPLHMVQPLTTALKQPDLQYKASDCNTSRVN